MFTRLLADSRFTFRRVHARPALFLLSALTVALVVGAGSAVFAVANAAFVRPLPFPDAGRLVRIYLLPPGVRDLDQANPLHPLDFVRLRERLTVGQGPEGFQLRERGLGGDGDPESVPAASVSAGVFRLLGATPAHGRTFTAEEDLAGAPVVVLSHALWRRRFGGRPEAVGQFLDIDRVRHQIVGVMRPDFEPAYVRSELWTPLGIHAGHLPLPNATYIVNVVRLASGTTLGEFEAEVRSILATVSAESPQTLKDWTSGVQTLREAQYGPQRTPLLLLLGAVAALAIIAAANLLNLTLTRVIGRRPEAALRRALGAGTADLVRAEILEALIIAAIGGGLGVLIAAATLPMLLALDTAVGLRPALTGVGIDWRVAASTFGLSLLVAVAAAVVPAVREAMHHRSGAFADLGRRASAHPRQHRTRAMLVVAQTALACLLLSAAFLLVGAYDRTARSEPGFSAERVLTAQLRLSESVYTGAEARVGLLNGVLNAVRSTPGVTDAGTTMNLMVPGFAFVTLTFTSDPPDPNEVARTVQFRRVSDGYFKTMRIPLQTGRDFDDRDTTASPPVVVVSRQFVDQYLAGKARDRPSDQAGEYGAHDRGGRGRRAGRRLRPGGAADAVPAVSSEQRDAVADQPRRPHGRRSRACRRRDQAGRLVGRSIAAALERDDRFGVSPFVARAAAVSDDRTSRFLRASGCCCRSSGSTASRRGVSSSARARSAFVSRSAAAPARSGSASRCAPFVRWSSARPSACWPLYRFCGSCDRCCPRLARPTSPRAGPRSSCSSRPAPSQRFSRRTASLARILWSP